MIETLAEVAGGVVALGASTWLLDQVMLWMEGRGWVYWRRRKGLPSIGVALMQQVSPAAQVVRQAMEQERLRKNVRPAEEPPFHVDLDAGVARVRSLKSPEDKRSSHE